MSEFDEGRVTIGTRGYVNYLTGEPIACTVVAIQVAPQDGHLWAKCADTSGNTRWFPLERVITDKEVTQ